MRNLIYILILYSVAGLAFGQPTDDIDSDLATPGATVLAYCHSGVFDVNSKYFDFAKVDKNSIPEKFVSKNCRIIKEHKTTIAGQKIDDSRVAESSDIEVTLEIEDADGKGHYQTKQYWYLLRLFPVGWKIIVHAMVGADS
jgi:hypothetical protein